MSEEAAHRCHASRMHRFCCVCLLLVLGSLVAFAQGDCGLLDQSSSVQDLTAFLSSSLNLVPEQRDAACIEFALRHLEYKPSEETAKLVVRYLDFERPLSEAERRGFMVHGPMTEANMHPAIGTLMTFGQTATPTLLSVIGDSPSEMTARNAVHALMAIFRGDPVKGVELLEEQSATHMDRSAENFRMAAEKAVHWCGKQYRQQCESVVRTHSR